MAQLPKGGWRKPGQEDEKRKGHGFKKVVEGGKGKTPSPKTELLNAKVREKVGAVIQE